MGEARCPKCASDLRFGPDGDAPVGSCYECWGLWVHTPRLRTIRGPVHGAASALCRATDEFDPSQAKNTELACPFCPGERLVRQFVRTVELEWCPSCRGIYLDSGERERLIGLPTPARHRAGSSDGPVYGGGGVEAVEKGMAMVPVAIETLLKALALIL